MPPNLLCAEADLDRVHLDGFALALSPLTEFDCPFPSNGATNGLAAHAFTADADKVDKLGQLLEAGMVGINHFAVVAADLPFSGHKKSGWGTEQASEGIFALPGNKAG